MALCYELLFKGKVDSSINVETAKMRLSFVYHVEPSELSHLFSGETFILKSFDTEEDGQPYLEGLTKLGLIVEMFSYDPDAPEALTEAQEQDIIDLNVEATIPPFDNIEEEDEPEEAIYSILFSGKISEEISQKNAQQALQEVLYLEAEDVGNYFDGQTHTLVSRLTNEDAADLVDQLSDRGLHVVIGKEEHTEEPSEIKDSNASKLFKIIFLGKCAEGIDPEKSLSQMASIFNLPIEQLAALFDKRSHMIKSNLCLSDAESLADVLRKIGLLVEIKPQN